MDDQRDVLGAEASNIAVLITRLRGVLLGLISWDWEREYRCNDLAEKVQRLEEQLSDVVMPYGNWPDPSSTAPDAARKQGNEVLIIEISDLQQEKRNLETQIKSLQSRNWELEYKCSDLTEEVGRLRTQLRRSIPLDNVPQVSTQPETALERALQTRVRKSEGVVRPT